MNGYLRLTRPLNAAIGALGLVIACFVAAGYNLSDNLTNLFFGVAVAVFAMAGGNALNDYVDREIDKTAHPDRPIPSGEVSPEAAFRCSVVFFAIAIGLSVPILAWDVIVIAALAVALMVAYETSLKKKGFAGNLCIAFLTAMIFLFAGSLMGDYSRVWILGLLAFLVTVGREIAKDIEDEESDRIERYTLPMAIGDRKAASVAALFFVLGPIFSFLPLYDGTFGTLYLTVFLADAMFIYCAWCVFGNPHRAQKLAKTAMFAALVAFVLGAIQV